jgi:hypothetical protein
MKSIAPACLLAASLALAAGGAAARQSSLAQASLAQAFRTCADLPAHPLAGDLMRSVWEFAERGTFAARHASQTRRYRVIDPRADETAARTAIVDLVHPAPVAGVSPRVLTATACEFGCRQRMWSLEFGVLTAPQLEKLAGWVADSATGGERAGQVELAVDSDGSTALICDIDG